MKESLFFVSCIDVTILLINAWLLFRHGKISIYHPAATYLAFHAFAFTTRIIFLINGADFFLENQNGYFSEIEINEITRAIFLADIGFISMTIAWLLEARRKLEINLLKPVILLDDNVMKYVLCFTIPLGIWGVIMQLYIPGIGKSNSDFGIWSESSYIANTQNWLLLSSLILIFKYGFRKTLLVIVGISFFILAFQGQHRYRIVTAFIFLLFLYLYREKKKWISFKSAAMLIVGITLFLPLKYFGKLIQQGASKQELIEFIFEYRDSFGLGVNADFSFLDMYASILTLIDQHGKYFYGSTYLTLLLAPIPRPFWEAKPSLMQWMTDISTPSRNLRELGAVATIYGESYANFGYVGVIIIPFLFAKYSARWYYKILNTHPQSANLYLYLYFSAVIIQVYRDGLNAIFIFLSVYNMPGFFVYFFSILKQKRV